MSSINIISFYKREHNIIFYEDVCTYPPTPCAQVISHYRVELVERFRPVQADPMAQTLLLDQSRIKRDCKVSRE